MYLELRTYPHIHFIQLSHIAVIPIIQMGKLPAKISTSMPGPTKRRFAAQCGLQIVSTSVSALTLRRQRLPCLLCVQIQEESEPMPNKVMLGITLLDSYLKYVRP